MNNLNRHHIPVGIAIYDKDGFIISFNNRDQRIFDVNIKEGVIDTNLFDEPNTPKWVKDKLKNGEDVEFELESDFSQSKGHSISTENSEIRLLSVKYTIIYNKKGNFDGYLQICEDVTDKCKNNSIIDLMFKNLPLGIIVYDNNGKLLSLNKNNRDIMGITHDVDLTGLNLFEEPHLTKEYCEQLQRGENVSFELEYDFANLDGYYPTHLKNIKHLQIDIAVIKSENSVLGYILSNQDKTSIHKREALLEKANVKFASVFSSMSSGIEIFDTNGTMVDCNERNLEILGIKNKENFLSHNISLFTNPNHPQYLIEKLRNKEEVYYDVWYDFDLVNNENYFKSTRLGKAYLKVKGSPMHTEKDELIGYLLEINDATKDKEQEERLKNLHSELKLALSAGKLAAWSYDIKNRYFTTLQGNALAGSGMSYDDSEKILHPDDRRNLKMLIDDLSLGRKNDGIITLRYYSSEHADYRYYESEMNVHRDGDGNIISIIGTQRDITEKCMNEFELNNAKKSLDMVMDASKIMAWDYDILTKKRRILYGNKLIEKHTKKVDDYYNLRFKEHEKFQELINSLVKGEIEQGSVDISIEENGHFYTFEHTASSIKNKEGRITGLIGSMYDITERIERQNELEKTHKELNLALEAGDVKAWVFTVDDQIFHFLLNKSKNDAIISFEDKLKMLHPDDVPLLKEIINDLSIGNKVRSEAVIRLKDSEESNTYRYYECKMVAQIENAKVSTITGTQKDITEREEIKNELIKTKDDALQANQILNDIIDRIPGAMYIKEVSESFRYLRINDLFCQYTG